MVSYGAVLPPTPAGVVLLSFPNEFDKAGNQGSKFWGIRAAFLARTHTNSPVKHLISLSAS